MLAGVGDRERAVSALSLLGAVCMVAPRWLVAAAGSAACASLAVAANSPKSFGGARSQIVLKTSTEFELLNHTVTPTAQGASINFWWITGTPWEGGPSHGGSSGQAAGVDYAIWRFYLVRVRCGFTHL